MAVANYAKSLIALPDSEAREVGWALRALQGVEVQAGYAPALVTEEAVRPLDIRRTGLAALDSIREVAPGTELWIVEGVLDPAARGRLEDAGIGFVDAAGAAWLPGVPRTTLRRESGPAAISQRRRMRTPTVLMAQWLADHPRARFNAPALAAHAGCSLPTAQSFLARLEHEGIVSRSGRGRSASRRVLDPRRMRSWLAERARPGKVERVECYFRDPLQLPESSVLPIVMTGAAAAERTGVPVLSRVGRVLYRVGASGRDLEEVPSMLGGTRTGKGANAVLIADPDGLASHDAREKDGLMVAPASRVMLDLFLEPRGEAAAEAFLDLWQDRDL